MTTSSLKTQIYFPSCFPTFKNSTNFPYFLPIKPSSLRLHSHPLKQSVKNNFIENSHQTQKKPSDSDIIKQTPCENSRSLIVGAVSVGVLLFLMGWGEEKALALGPEGPLVEEFWDNVRRYGLYALTVSTGAIYTIFLPILELLKNPISAILVLVIFGGGIFIVSQVLSAMIGVSDFSYQYAY